MREHDLLGDASVGVAAMDAIRLAATGVLVHGTRVNIGHLGTETTDQRLDAVRAVARAGLVPVAHLSARRFASRTAVQAFLTQVRRIAVDAEVFVIGGDPVRPAGPYADALAMLSAGEFERNGVESVGVGGHPDGHPEIHDDILWRALEEKVDLLLRQGRRASIITQLSTDPDSVLRWIASARDRGISAPIAIGMPGPLAPGALVQYPRRAAGRGTRSAPLARPDQASSVPPADFLSRVAAAIDPRTHGVVGLHVFGLGDPAETARYMANATGLPDS